MVIVKGGKGGQRALERQRELEGAKSSQSSTDPILTASRRLNSLKMVLNPL